MTRRSIVESEESLIREFLAPLAAGFPGAFGLEDDCALITPAPGTDLVFKTDPIAEGVHFMPGAEPENLAWKSLAVNVSDLVAKGAKPVAYLMALSLPAAPERAWMARLAAGLKVAQDRFGMHLIGGDTDRRPGPMSITITAIGTIPHDQMVRRGAARPGDKLFVSGSIGDAYLGLALSKDAARAEAWQLSRLQAQYLIARYVRPEPRLRLAPALVAHASAAIDVSDGLVKDLDRVVRASGVSVSLEARRVPISAAARKVLDHDRHALSQLITGGDDYEILAAVPPLNAADFSRAAAAAGITVTEIGEIGSGPARFEIIGTDGSPLAFDKTGWDHFANA